MAPRKKRLVAMIGIVAGFLALRTLRKRRSAPEPVEHEHGDLDTATEHATAATEHARLAAKKAVKREN